MSETMFYILFALRTERHGQVLGRVGQCSSIRMTLQDGGPATYRYVVDVQGRPRLDYLTTYQDFGWEHLGRTSNIHLWRRAYDGARPEAFTDADSLRARSRRFEIPRRRRGRAVRARRRRAGGGRVRHGCDRSDGARADRRPAGGHGGDAGPGGAADREGT